MKRGVVFLMAFLISSVLGLQAQNPNLERLNAYKIAFLTNRLKLTPQEAEKFWPVYNEFQDRRNKIQQERALLNRNLNQNYGSMTEKEIIDAGDKYVDLQVQEASLAQEFHKKLKEILPPLKVVRLYQAENQYRMQLLKELQQRKPLKNEQ